MDKRNFSIGVILLIAAFAMLIFGPRSTPSTQPAVPHQPITTAQPASSSPAVAGPEAPKPAPNGAAAAPVSTFAAISRDAANATVTTLSNDFIEARLTNFGGAVREVAFKKYPAELKRPEPYVFNQLHEAPMLALSDFPGLNHDTAYQVVSSSATEVVYRTVLDERIEVTRRYRLMKDGEAGADPYRIHHETTFRNLTASPVALPRASLSIGTAGPLNSSDPAQYLSVASYDGKDTNFIARGDLDGGGIGSIVGAGSPAKPMLEHTGPILWTGVKNQFFTSLYTSEKPGVSVTARRIELPPFPESKVPNIGLAGAARFDLPGLGPNGSQRLAGVLFVGPQEYKRLAKFEHNEDRVLPYTQYFFNRIFLSGYVAPLLNTLLNATHRWVGNWGVAVILMTLILKFVSLPFTLAASKSAKRMSKLQPLMQEIREKYKDNPQKQQQATMELFKAHKVNPLGGCIPILITMPLFIGFFSMLQSPAELRFQPFLWAKDLADQDTVAYIFGIRLNIMPLLMGATMWYQMKLTPTPSVDNMQVKMMKFMPVIFTLFCYSFSCALALYSTINGIFTIVQQVIINRMKDDPGPGSPGTAAVTTISALGKGMKGMKNVTPKPATSKKKLK
ncbi:MAG: YidC/Oxa1 family insertase periplasmic-domain containing protein [Opitutaceae bacterium]|nr:YidC/Oxa1 family insertase periplasmic-domain containing protein [Opitutaceae bacterium]